MFCKKCGSEVQDGVMFCKNCGQRISETQNSYVSPMPVAQGKTSVSNPMNYLKYIIAVVAVIVIVIVAKNYFGNAEGFSSYEDAVKAFITAMDNKNEDEYLNCFPKELRETIAQGIETQAGYEATGQVGGDIWGAYKSPYRFLFAPDGYNMTYTLENSVDVSQEQIDSYKKQYDLKIKEGKLTSIKLAHSYPSFGGTVTRSNTLEVPIVKIGRKWLALEPLELEGGGWPLGYEQ